ncbi:hypothetical protein EC957_010420 [Mortierella hygrophila]|uniref:Uncharacterized protein n=1 Tax=Mortierella hygrophila TaxID=979708 RepID=A0A9P6FAX2_9FUNG|nr:hypothetical protein EC957_010420 [Mortierella hygrophila]
METEYLDIVNKELHDIQQFFAHYYYPSPPLTNPQHALTVLPLLKPNTTLTSPPSSLPSPSYDTDTLHGGGDDLFDFPSLYHTSPPPPPSSCGEEMDRYVADIRDRYKQLKAIQDQMHLELTRSRILRQSIEVVGVTKVDDDVRLSPSPLQEKKKGEHSNVRREKIEPLPFSDSPGGKESMTTLPFSESPASITTTTKPTPQETTGTTIITTTTETGTTIITTATLTATAETAGPFSILPQEPPQTSPFTLANIRRLTDMIYRDAKTLLSSSPIMTYTILGMVFGVLLVGWLDCANYDIDSINNNNNNHRVVDPQAPMTDQTTQSTFVPPVPEEFVPPVPRYPWPRH